MVERVGPDRVVPKGDGLIVFSGREMDDWRPATHRKTIVVFRDRRYFVTSRHVVGRQTWRYVLRPWKENPQEVPGRVIQYDPKYALVHDAMVRADKLDRGVFALLWAISPLLGFLPSRLKLLLEARYGFDPIRLTLFSMLVEYFVVLACGVWLSAMVMAGAFGAASGEGFNIGGFTLGRAALAVAVLIPDLVARTSRLLSGSLDQYGFYEWLFRLFGRR